MPCSWGPNTRSSRVAGASFSVTTAHLVARQNALGHLDPPSNVDHDQPEWARVGTGTRTGAGDRDRAWRRRRARWNSRPPARRGGGPWGREPDEKLERRTRLRGGAPP